ncbi:hypothetical protein C8R44DRAFT_746075 [Mycena epipterygia]|nr:hypothetical protein C8R44DRAFT_746075 [Mycena epipterygia]
MTSARIWEKVRAAPLVRLTTSSVKAHPRRRVLVWEAGGREEVVVQMSNTEAAQRINSTAPDIVERPWHQIQSLHGKQPALGRRGAQRDTTAGLGSHEVRRDLKGDGHIDEGRRAEKRVAADGGREEHRGEGGEPGEDEDGGAASGGNGGEDGVREEVTGAH